jgi:hypothetical protein
VVIKLSPEGRVLLTLGKPGVMGGAPENFLGPAAVLVAPNGDMAIFCDDCERTKHERPPKSISHDLSLKEISEPTPRIRLRRAYPQDAHRRKLDEH